MEIMPVIIGVFGWLFWGWGVACSLAFLYVLLYCLNRKEFGWNTPTYFCITMWFWSAIMYTISHMLLFKGVTYG